MIVHLSCNKIAILACIAFTVSLSFSCNHEKSEYTVLKSELIRSLDSTRHYVFKLDSYIEEGKSNSHELEVLKAENSKILIVANSDLLSIYLDSIQHNTADIKNSADFKLQVKTQIDYVNSLIASAKAILRGDSQNFGKWE